MDDVTRSTEMAELVEADPPDPPRTEAKTTRGRFLKRLGVTLAAGIGVAGILASTASASAGHCCRNCSQCGSCGDKMNGCYCLCDCTGIGSSYCIQTSSWCQAPGDPCPMCPC